MIQQMHHSLSLILTQILHVLIHHARKQLTDFNSMKQYSEEILNYQLSQIKKILIKQLMLMYNSMQNTVTFENPKIPAGFYFVIALIPVFILAC